VTVFRDELRREVCGWLREADEGLGLGFRVVVWGLGFGVRRLGVRG
jgi:hypothetical protein